MKGLLRKEDYRSSEGPTEEGNLRCKEEPYCLGKTGGAVRVLLLREDSKRSVGPTKE